jgi:hypothetical protein
MFDAHVRNHAFLSPTFEIKSLGINKSASKSAVCFDDEEPVQFPTTLPFLKVASIYLPMDDSRHKHTHNVPYYTYYFLVLAFVDGQPSTPVFQRIGLALFDVYEPLQADHSAIIGTQTKLKLI